jgi:hypothetical protein
MQAEPTEFDTQHNEPLSVNGAAGKAVGDVYGLSSGSSDATALRSLLKSSRRQIHKKAAFIMVGSVLFVVLGTWAYGLFAVRFTPPPSPPVVGQMEDEDYDDPGHDNLSAGKDTFTINRNLQVKGAATLHSLTILEDTESRGHLKVSGNGIFEGDVLAANFIGSFFGDGSGLTGIRASNCTACVALQGASTIPQVGNIHLDGTVRATNFYGNFQGDGSRLTNLPGLKGNFVALQNISPGTQQSGHLNISGNGIFGTNLSVGGTVTVAGATALNGTLNVSGTTTLSDLIAGGQIRLTGNTADRLLIQPTADPSNPTNVFTIKNVAGTEQASLSSDGVLSLAGNANIGGSGSVAGSLTVAGASVLQGNTAVGGTLSVTGATSLSDLSAAATTLSSLSVVGGTTLSGATSLGSTLSVSGAVSLNSSLTVAGAATLDSLNVTNAGSFGGNLTVGGALAVTGTVEGSRLVSTVATGTAPLTVNSTTKVTNLNVDLLDGLDSTAFAPASGSGNYIQNGTAIQVANFAIQSAAPSNVGAVIRGAASQTADLLQLQNSAGTALARVDSVGNVYGAGLYVNRRFDQGVPNGGIYFINGAGTAYLRPISYDHNSNTLKLGNGVTAVAVNSTGTFNVTTAIGGGGFKATVGAGTTFTVNDHTGGPAGVLQGNHVSQVGYVVRGVASQLADLQQWQNSDGTVLSRVLANGNLAVGSAGSITTGVHIQNRAAGDKGLVVQGVASQAGDLLQAQDSAGAVLAKIDAGGSLTVKDATVQGTLTVAGAVSLSSTLTVAGNATFNGDYVGFSNNVRGINQAITTGATTLAVAFGTAHADAAYAVNCTPSYDTTCFATNKTTTGFILNFGTAAPASAAVDWFVVR